MEENKVFWIDFFGYCKVKAKNAEEAKEKFWEDYQNMKFEHLYDDVMHIEGIEED